MTSLNQHLAELRVATESIEASPELKARLIDIAAGESARPTTQGSESFWSRLRQTWSQLPRIVRVAPALALVIGVFGIIALKQSSVGCGGASFCASDESRTVFTLGSVPTHDCFGLGPGTTHMTADKAQFTFDFPVTAKKALATLTFNAGSVAHGDEVDISVGAAHQGFANRSSGDDLQSQEVRLTSKSLRPNEKNQLVFDNLRNPPANEQWVICSVAVRIDQLPDGSNSDLLAQARAEILIGDRDYQDKLIGASDLYGAWKAYRKAGLYLEAMDPKVDEYEVVMQKIRDCRRELDAQCAKLMLKGHAFEKENKLSDAINLYQRGLVFFPDNDHPCFDALKGRLVDLE